jgi:hypothetical protein
MAVRVGDTVANLILRLDGLSEGCNNVSGKPHRKIVKKVVRLKAFHVCCEVSGKLMIPARRGCGFVHTQAIAADNETDVLT